MHYARADIDMKRQVLAEVFPDVVRSVNSQMIIGHDGAWWAGYAACRDSYVE